MEGRNGAQLLELGKVDRRRPQPAQAQHRRNGAQLLELGKAQAAPPATTDQSSRNGAQLLELGKANDIGTRRTGFWKSQWSPAFRAGKSTKKRRKKPFR